MPVLLFTIGFLSLLGQVILLRETADAFFGSELILLLAIAFWMVWTGIGALLAGKRRSAGPRAIPLALAAFAAVLPASVLFLRSVRILFGGVPGAFLPIERQFAAILLTPAPAGFLLGALFVFAARRAAGSGRFAAAYGIESAGAALGGIASVFLLAGKVPPFSTALLLSTVAVLAAAWAVRRRRARVLSAAAAAIPAALLLFAGSPIDRATLSWHAPGLVESRDTPYGRITLVERGEQLVLFRNGALLFETQSTEPEETVHPALLQRDGMKRVLVIGGGPAGTVREVLRHRPERVDVVEIDRQAAAVLRERLPETAGRALADRSVRIFFADGRRFLREGGERYDAILTGMGEPNSGAANRYYTREFFRLCRDRLRPGGVLAFRISGAEQIWTASMARRNGSILRALEEVFADAVVLPGGRNLFLASDEPLTRDPEPLIRRFEERKIDARLLSAPHLRYLYTNDRFAGTARALREAETPVNRDDRPVCYPFTLLARLSRFHRPLADLRFTLGREAWAFPAAAAVLFLLLRRRRRRGARLLLAAVAGGAGAALEFALLLRFQTEAGALYRDVGALLAAFMLGLAAGPLAGRRAAHSFRGGAVLTGSFALLAFASALFLRGGPAGSLAASAAVLFLAGLGTGGIYCWAARKDPEAGPSLYGADLAGGSAGAVAAALLLLPFLGLAETALWAGLLLAAALPAARGDR